MASSFVLPDGFLILSSQQDLVIDGVWQIIQECSTWLAEQGADHWQKYYTRQIVELKAHKSTLYLLTVNDIPVGTVTLGIYPPTYYSINEEEVDYVAMFQEPKAQALYVTALAVRPAYQGKGYAKLLMHVAEDVASLQGSRYVRLDARSDSHELLRFYNGLGYKIVGEMQDDPVPFLLFEKLNNES